MADALARRAPRRLALQAYVDANLLRKEATFRARWRYRGRIEHVGHHDAHAASTFFPSPFDQAAVLTLDRGGDFLSTTLQVGAGSRLVRLAQIPIPTPSARSIRRSPGIWGSSPTPMRARPWGWPL